MSASQRPFSMRWSVMDPFQESNALHRATRVIDPSQLITALAGYHIKSGSLKGIGIERGFDSTGH